MTVFDRGMDSPDGQPTAFMGNQRKRDFMNLHYPGFQCARVYESWHILFRVIETVFHHFGFPGGKIPSLSTLSATGFMPPPSARPLRSMSPLYREVMTFPKFFADFLIIHYR